jgi:hypothetical protein
MFTVATFQRVADWALERGQVEGEKSVRKMTRDAVAILFNAVESVVRRAAEDATEAVIRRDTPRPRNKKHRVGAAEFLVAMTRGDPRQESVALKELETFGKDITQNTIMASIRLSTRKCARDLFNSDVQVCDDIGLAVKCALLFVVDKIVSQCVHLAIALQKKKTAGIDESMVRRAVREPMPRGLGLTVIYLPFAICFYFIFL